MYYRIPVKLSKSWNNDNQPNRGIFYTLSQSYAFSLKKAKTFRIYSARYPQQNHMEANPHGKTIFDTKLIWRPNTEILENARLINIISVLIINVLRIRLSSIFANDLAKFPERLICEKDDGRFMTDRKINSLSVWPFRITTIFANLSMLIQTTVVEEMVSFLFRSGWYTMPAKQSIQSE